jgi:hypothetical protein
MFFFYCIVGDLVIKWGWVGILLTNNQTLHHFCVCPKPAPVFMVPNVMVFSLWQKVIVLFVDIGRIVVITV